MDNLQAENETLKQRFAILDAMYAEKVRELDARDRLTTEVKAENIALKGQLRRMQIDRNSEE